MSQTNPSIFGGCHIRVGTFNVRFDCPTDVLNPWRDRAPLVASIIRFHKFDVIGLQEPLLHQIHDIHAELPEYDWTGSGREDGKQAGEFCPIFFRKDRFSVRRTGTVWLSDTPEMPGTIGWDAHLPRIVTWAELTDNAHQNKPFIFLSAHWDHNGRKAREESAKLCLSFMSHLAHMAAGKTWKGGQTTASEVLHGSTSSPTALELHSPANRTFSQIPYMSIPLKAALHSAIIRERRMSRSTPPIQGGLLGGSSFQSPQQLASSQGNSPAMSGSPDDPALRRRGSLTMFDRRLSDAEMTYEVNGHLLPRSPANARDVLAALQGLQSSPKLQLPPAYVPVQHSGSVGSSISSSPTVGSSPRFIPPHSPSGPKPATEDPYFVFVGDLNAETFSREYSILAEGFFPTPFSDSPGLRLMDTRRVCKRPPHGPDHSFTGFPIDKYKPMLIDYIFVTENFTVVDHAILHEHFQDGKVASDHCPVVADLRFE